MNVIANHQPYLNATVAGVRAPAFALGDDDGQIHSEGVQGIYVADRRVVTGMLVRVGGVDPVSVSTRFVGADVMRNESVVPGLGDSGVDPTVLMTRSRRLVDGAAYEDLVLTSYARVPVSTALEVAVTSDLAEITDVKNGVAVAPLVAEAVEGGLRWRHDDGTEATATVGPPPETVEPGKGLFRWRVELAPGASFTAQIRLSVTADPVPPVVRASPTRELERPTVEGADPRLDAWVAQSVADLAGLLLADPSAPADRFFGAGIPWYLTLFGRDSLIAASLALPIGTDIARGTLAALARRQGERLDADSAEEPGKILHEIRRVSAVRTVEADEVSRTVGLSLPPVYYGTVDASPLWVMLLHDAWRHGLAADVVEPLVPTLVAALRWMRDHASDERGFLTYLDRSGHGLTNQGWKDSHDSVQYADGRLARGPIALSEVQGYAYAAARRGADVLGAFGVGGAEEWREWAAQLRRRFRAAFWTEDEAGPYPGIGLDGDGHLVDSVASNMGHLLATGILDPGETSAVAARLGGRELSSGYGLRTLATTSAGFNPLSYHAGSVWTHDTAMAVHGLGVAARQGVREAADSAATLIRGLLAAAADFDFRMPELHGGFARSASSRVSAYPASCRPQAWAAASVLTVLQTILGLEADVPNGVLTIRPLRPSPLGAVTVRGLVVGDGRLDVAVDRSGVPTVLAAPAGLRILT